MDQLQKATNSDRGLDTKTKPEPSKWGNIPWDKFNDWHIESLIEEMGDIRLDLGMYRRMLKNPETSYANRKLLENLLKLDQQRLYLLKAEIENERFRQENPK